MCACVCVCVRVSVCACVYIFGRERERGDDKSESCTLVSLLPLFLQKSPGLQNKHTKVLASSPKTNCGKTV